ncbi:MAG: signal peptidase I [Bacteroidaceae bacterium]|nr:signal peptidase I [Bacteroidaceae bacterium]
MFRISISQNRQALLLDNGSLLSNRLIYIQTTIKTASLKLLRSITEHFAYGGMLAMAACCIMAVAYCAVRIFVADQFIIPTWSMAPTLIPGDRVVVNKLIMGARIYTDFDFVEGGQELRSMRMKGLRRLRHNDIVVFNYPQVGGRMAFRINYVYCKRCIALPGDTLSIEDGHYRCNNYGGTLGLRQEQERLETVPDDAYDAAAMAVYPFDERVGWTFKHMGPLYIPRRGDITALGAKEGTVYGSLLEYETGKSVTVDWESDSVLLDGVPAARHRWRHNYYFMAGDNVHDSMDSRYWGLVPEEYVVGVVQMISYSKDRETDTIKWERILLAR